MTRLSIVPRAAAASGLVVAILSLLFTASVLRAEPDPGFTSGPLLQKLLAGPLGDVEEIVFAVRVPGRDHWYVTFGNYADFSETPAKELSYVYKDGVYWGYGEGSRLCRLNLRTGVLTVLLEDMRGGIRDPQVHYEGRRILFSYRPGGTDTFHLYEINVDGSGLRQLTDGPDDDIEPTYCPDGSIVFCSSRCRRFVNCWHTRVATLYRCDADGGNIRMLSSNLDHDNTPWLLPDGRVLYMRWEYVDRSQVHFHHLWTMNPDGTSQTVFFGNLHGGIAMLDAKPIPGTKKIVASFSPGHGRPEHFGHVTIVDPSLGPDVPSAARNLTKRPDWKDPYALSEDCILVASRQGIHVMDGAGNAERIYRLSETEQWMQCHEPRPVQPRPREPVLAQRAKTDVASARLILQDVGGGRKMASVPPGTVQKLLVLRQLPKPVNFSGGMQPLTIGGSFTLAEIVGEVPVYPDGSANMELPPLQSLFFVALDAQDRPVKRMHSFVTLQPGEQASCVGCHEHRTGSPLPADAELLALKHPPSRPQRIDGVPTLLDFPRDIQPILDRRCVECHCPEKREGNVDLTGDRTAMYSLAYWTMQTRGLVADGRNREQSNYDPYVIGSAASRLMQFLDASHYKVRLTELERTTIRLWIETSACYPGTYGSLGCGSVSVQLPYSQMVQRCGTCHVREVQDDKGTRKVLRFKGGWDDRLEPLSNLSRPEKSYLLLAPLAKESGGLGLCSEPMFRSPADPLYQLILAAIRDAHDRLQDTKRFDMPGFRPNEHYIREMQRFGILPANLNPEEPIDCYAVDRAYWDSFTYRAD